MFVPSSEGEKLLKKLEEVEDLMEKEVRWRPKLIEKSGIQLSNMFRRKFPLKDGCPLGKKCNLCENQGVKCAVKGVVY